LILHDKNNYMFNKLKSTARKLKQEINVYRLVLKDHRTPRLAKVCLWCAIGYAIMPFDIIPDFIPIIGQLDDLIIVPALIIIAVKLTPKEVIKDCRAMVCNPKMP